jgi:hypothetical protein
MTSNAEKALAYLKESAEIADAKLDTLMAVETLVNN